MFLFLANALKAQKCESTILLIFEWVNVGLEVLYSLLTRLSRYIHSVEMGQEIHLAIWQADLSV